MDESFGPELRLNSPASFQKIFKTGIRHRDESFLSRAEKNKKEIARLGISISKKNVPGAAERNRIKRQIRESFRKNRKLMAGLDIIVVVVKKPVLSNNNKLCALLDRHWQILSTCKN